jgi:hypothetical protein
MQPHGWVGKSKIISAANKIEKIKLNKGDTIILDFGRNMVGYLQDVSNANATIKI